MSTSVCLSLSLFSSLKSMSISSVRIKEKTELPYDLAIVLSGRYPEGTATVPQWAVCAPRVRCSITHNSRDTETSRCPRVDEWMKKMYKHPTEYYSAFQNGNSAICDNMVEPGGQRYAKWNKPETERQRQILHDSLDVESWGGKKKSQTQKQRVKCKGMASPEAAGQESWRVTL